MNNEMEHRHKKSLVSGLLDHCSTSPLSLSLSVHTHTCSACDCAPTDWPTVVVMVILLYYGVYTGRHGRISLVLTSLHPSDGFLQLCLIETIIIFSIFFSITLFSSNFIRYTFQFPLPHLQSSVSSFCQLCFSHHPPSASLLYLSSHFPPLLFLLFSSLHFFLYHQLPFYSHLVYWQHLPCWVEV